MITDDARESATPVADPRAGTAIMGGWAVEQAARQAVERAGG